MTIGGLEGNRPTLGTISTSRFRDRERGDAQCPLLPHRWQSSYVRSKPQEFVLPDDELACRFEKHEFRKPTSPHMRPAHLWGRFALRTRVGKGEKVIISLQQIGPVV
ncbi:hypothetical protein ZHAS_00021240 [Anopheles sinensis]|uniref:Uncharacterized protein n=1 Tax=Anopheles sinensis TaxID=74873 RepID=A0A084WRU5_ANOSI|nr:hypothetical protein ZHAS_00021240 [Anopheles sinensis]